MGQLTEAQCHYEEGVSLTNKEEDVNSWAEAIIALNTCLHAQGKLKEAIDGLMPLLDEAISLNLIGCLHRSLGNVYRSANRFHEAETHLMKAIDIAVSMNDSIKVTEQTAELGRVYRSSGLHHKALSHQTKAYKAALQRGDVAQVASICGEIGFTNYSLKEPNHREAIRYIGLRLLLASNVLHNMASVRWCLNNLGKVYHSMGDFDPAIQCFQRSLELVKGTGNLLGEGTALGNLGSVLRDAGQYREAVKYHKLYLENARERIDIGGEAIMLRELSFDYYLMDDYPHCLEYAMLGLVLVEKIRSSFELTDDQLKLGNHEKNEARIFNILQLVLRKLCLHKESLLVSEMARARAVFDLMTQKCHSDCESFTVKCSDIVTLEDGDVVFDARKVEEKCHELKMMAAKLGSTVLVYSVIDEPVSKKKQKDKWLYIWLVSDAEIVFEESVITNSVVDVSIEKNYLSTLKRDIGLKKKKTSKPPNIIPMSTQNITSSDTPHHHQESLHDPYQYLIQPIEHYLIHHASTRLIVIPYGFLYLVPFASLRNTKGQYLIDNYILSYVQSFSILSLLIQQTTGTPCCSDDSSLPLIVGNPVMPRNDIDQLKGAEREAACIKDIIGGNIITGKDADKTSVCKAIRGRSIVHFATHALLADSINEHIQAVEVDRVRVGSLTGDYSVKGAIVLAKSDQSCSGILTSSEIQHLNLSSCQLMTLSCCRSACGAVSGDGVLGLPRALLVAGAKCTVSTLWAIEDDVTVDLMTAFYSKYKETRDAAVALREAMLSMVANGYLPEQWSAFCVTGVSVGMMNTNDC